MHALAVAAFFAPELFEFARCASGIRICVASLACVRSVATSVIFWHLWHETLATSSKIARVAAASMRGTARAP